jgi:oligopeptide/dipeptide ABC transporter ATP-binding protein
MTAPLLETRSLGRDFARKTGWFTKSVVTRAVDDIDLALVRGDRLGIVGESGCGKSTLGRLLLGLTAPSSGSVHFDGVAHRDRNKADWKTFRRQTALVQQNPLAALDPQMNIGSQVAEPIVIHRLGDIADALHQAEEMLDRVGLGKEIMRRFPHQLSGGQRQRVVIARALITTPKLVIFDEAVSALDVSVQAQVIGFVNHLQREFRLTSVFISHDLRIIRHVSDQIAVMYLGRIVEHGPVDALYRRPRHPYTRALLAAVPKLDPQVKPVALITGEAAGTMQAGCRFRPRCPLAIARCAGEDPALREIAGISVACHRADEDVAAVPARIGEPA